MKKLLSRILLVSGFALFCFHLARSGPVTSSPAPALAVRAGGQDCTMYAITPASQSFPLGGGASECSVDTGPGGGECVWHAMPSDTWISVNTSDQSGDKTIIYYVASNTGDARTGSIQIITAGGAIVGTINISQDGVCSFTVNPAGAHFGASGGSGSFDATHKPGCPAAEPPITLPEWVTLSMSGSRFNYTVSSNSGGARYIVLSVGVLGLPASPGNFTISQDAAAACDPDLFAPSPSSTAVDRDGGPGSFKVSPPSSCGQWLPTSTVDWISLDFTPVPFGPGPGTVDFVVAPNKGSWRSGTIIVGGQQFHVYQDPVDCPADLICRFFPAACFITGDSTGLIDVSHSFRDKILARSDRGRGYISLYYQFSREAVRAMLSNPMLLIRSREILTRYKPVLQSIVSGEHVSLTRDDLQEIDEFLTAFSRPASPELRTALDRLRNDLENPAVHSEFNMTIVNGPRTASHGPSHW